MGLAYKAFRQSHNKTYNIFRCGLAHEYYVKRNCDIGMSKKKAIIRLKKNSIIGIEQYPDGKYYFVVEKYFEDFKNAFDALENSLYP